MCTYGRLCYDFDMIGTYLNKPEVQSEFLGLTNFSKLKDTVSEQLQAAPWLRLGVKKKWGSCNMAVDLSFVAAGDWLVRYQQLLPAAWQDWTGQVLQIELGRIFCLRSFWLMALMS